MDEARRFLRYVTPGLVFITETLIILSILFPGSIKDILTLFGKDGGLGVVVATLLASGGVGFIFSVIYHLYHWRFNKGAIDHSELIKQLREHQIITLIDAKTNANIPTDSKIDRKTSWVILTSLWHERLETSKYIKSAEPKVKSLVDIVHSNGTALVASVCAWLVSLAIAYNISDKTLNLTIEPSVRFALGNILGIFFVVIFYKNDSRVSSITQGVIEQVLHDELAIEKKTEQILTYVKLN